MKNKENTYKGTPRVQPIMNTDAPVGILTADNG